VKVCVLTVSDRAFRGEYEDLSGPAIEEILAKELPAAEIRRVVVPDEESDVFDAFEKAADCDFILTTGGTGLGPRDITPDATARWCEKTLPGISEILRVESYRETPQAMLSRGYAGVKGKTVVVNFPGSVKAVNLCTRVLLPVMDHAVSMLSGGGH
jgi:molybdenum cofactor synthesis domain-containing protein